MLMDTRSLLLALAVSGALVIVTAQPVAVSRLLTGVIRLLGGLLRLPAWMLIQVETGSASVLQKTLRWGGSEGEDSGQDTDAASAATAQRQTTHHWPGMIVIARLLYLAMGLAILVGAVSLDIPRSCVVQFDCNGTPSLLPIPASVANGLLWFALAVFWGILLLDTLDVVPKQLQLFTQLQPHVRRFLLWIAAIGEVMTTLAMALLYFIGQLAVYGGRWPAGSLAISALQGPLVNLAAILALWALIYGAVALVSVVCLVVWLLSALLRLPLHGADLLLGWVAETFVPHLIEAVAGTLRSVWNAVARLPLAHVVGLRPLPSIHTAIAQGALGGDPLPPLPHHALDAATATSALPRRALPAAPTTNTTSAAPRSRTWPADKSAAAPSSRGEQSAPSESTTDPGEEAHTSPNNSTENMPEDFTGDELGTLSPLPRAVVPIVPQPVQPLGEALRLSPAEMLLAPEEEVVMNSPSTYLRTTLLGIDESGQRFIRRLLYATATVGGIPAVRALGLCNLSSLSEVPAALEPVVGDVIDISIIAAEVQVALEQAHQPERTKELLINHLCEKVVRVNKGLLEGQGMIVVAQDIRSLASSQRALSLLHKRLPLFTIVLIGFLPTPDQYDQLFADGALALRQLKREGAIACTLLVDPASPLAQTQGNATQEDLVAKALASVLVGHAHGRDNPLASEIFTRLGAHAAFVGLAVGSASVVAGSAPRDVSVFAQLLGTAPRGKGELNDIRSRAQELTERLLADDVGRTIDVPPALDRGPVFVTYTAPLRREDVRWPQLRDSLTPWLVETFPSAAMIPSLVQGNGVADGSLAGRKELAGSSPYYVQVSVFYAIPTVMFEGPGDSRQSGPDRPPEDDDQPQGGGDTTGGHDQPKDGKSGGPDNQGKGRRRRRVQPLEDRWRF
jgi:hypothetical protein